MNQTRDTMPDLARAMEDAFDDYCLPLSLIPGTGIALGIAQAAAGIAAGGAGARAREQANARATVQATAQANSTSIAPPMVTAVPTEGADDCSPNCIVRAGEAAYNKLQDGYTRVTVPGFEDLYGFSVQWEPGVSLHVLASQGFRNSLISYAKDYEIIAAATALGYGLGITPTRPAFGEYHATVTAYDRNGNMLRALPMDLAVALSAAFARKISNPNRR